MNGNKMSPFVNFPEYELERKQPRGLVSMGELMEGGGDPFRGNMPVPVMPPQQQLSLQQDYDEGPAPQGKKILGMPKDQFIALMGTIAHAFGGDSPSGRMGTGLINMAGMMRQERMGKAEARTAEIKEKRKAAAEAAKEKREAAVKKKGKAPTVRTFRVGDMDVQHSFDYETREWKPIPGMPGKEAKETKEGKKPPTIRTFRIGDKDVQHAWDTDTEKWKTIPGMPGKKVKPPAGEKPKEMSFAEKRARTKSAKESEAKILNPEYQSAEYQDELQLEIDSFDRYSDKPYTYQLTPGKIVDWGRDVPPKVEKVDISTPEKIMDSNLPDDMKRKLLLKRFPDKFE